MYLKPLLLLFLILGMIGCASADVNIIEYTPLDTTPTAINGSNVSFSANFSESGFYEWLINDSVTANGTANYTMYNYSTSAVGDFNITIRTNDTQHGWILTVEELDDAIHAGYWQKWTGTGWDFVNTTPTNNSASLDGQLEVTVS